MTHRPDTDRTVQLTEAEIEGLALRAMYFWVTFHYADGSIYAGRVSGDMVRRPFVDVDEVVEGPDPAIRRRTLRRYRHHCTCGAWWTEYHEVGT